MRGLRVLVLTNMYPPHHYGGYELNCQEFVEHLRAEGHDVLVLTSDIEVPHVAPRIEDRALVRRDLRLYWQDHVVLRPSPRQSLRIERANQDALSKALVEHRPDIVSVWHMGALSLGLLSTCHRRGIPLTHVVNDDWIVYGPWMDRWLAWCRRLGPLAGPLERVVGVPCRLPPLGDLGVFCFITDTTKTSAERAGGSFPQSVVGYCGINTRHFPISEVRNQPEWRWQLLHVGRIDDRKGIDLAIRALAHLPVEARLKVVGWGDDTHVAQLRELAKECRVAERVELRTAERSELAELYQAADVLLFLPRWAEPFGLVPIEAMACGTPVVATGTGGSSEFLLDGGNCLLTPKDDVETLVSRLRRLSEEPRLRETVARGGFATARELTLERWLRYLTDIHHRHAERQPLPPRRPRIAEVLSDRIGTADP